MGGLMKKNDETKRFLMLHKTRGKFYNVYDDDAHILHFLLGYKVLDNKKLGFPDSAITKVTNILDEHKISYQIFYTDKDPVVKDFKKLNKYSEIRAKALDMVELDVRLENIINKIKNTDKDKLIEILEMLESCLE